MDVESTVGTMAESMMESFWKTSAMEKECLSGLMVQRMKETSSKVNEKDMDDTHLVMAATTVSFESQGEW
jgi:hypothetical protein